MKSCIAACIQLNSQDDMAGNAPIIEGFIRDAAAQKANFIALPENAFLMQPPGQCNTPSPAPLVQKCQHLAEELAVWLLIGSIHEPINDGKYHNRSLLIDPHGHVRAHYDKIHLFDVTLTHKESYRESDRITGGDLAVLAHTPWGALGMTICYDVRFASLYRALAQAGASILSVPSAFTYTTGVAHWHALLRARAIETGCYVIAPAQCGIHPGNRRTYGHSLIVSPWGEILAEASENSPGIVMAKLDINEVQKARTRIPSLKHDRAYGLKSF